MRASPVAAVPAIALLLALGVSPGRSAPEAPAAAAPRPGVPAATLRIEIATVLAARDRTLRELSTGLRTATDPRLALELQTGIERAKLDANLAVPRIQADHARREGRTQ